MSTTVYQIRRISIVSSWKMKRNSLVCWSKRATAKNSIKLFRCQIHTWRSHWHGPQRWMITIRRNVLPVVSILFSYEISTRQSIVQPFQPANCNRSTNTSKKLASTALNIAHRPRRNEQQFRMKVIGNGAQMTCTYCLLFAHIFLINRNSTIFRFHLSIKIGICSLAAS